MTKRYVGFTPVENKAISNEGRLAFQNSIKHAPNPDSLTDEQLERAHKVLRERWGLN